MKARLAATARRAIQAAADAGYPHEVCGVLLGKLGYEPQVQEAVPCANLNTERSRDRYELDPVGQLAIEKDARQRGLDVVGYYHSHPDHSANASETDNSLSWEATLYLIQSVVSGRSGELRAWHRPPGQPRLAEAEILEA